jgi:hypothetical protein
VVGLETWELNQAGRPVEAVVAAETPARAVALAAWLSRKDETKGEKDG